MRKEISVKEDLRFHFSINYTVWLGKNHTFVPSQSSNHVFRHQKSWESLAL